MDPFTAVMILCAIAFVVAHESNKVGLRVAALTLMMISILVKYFSMSS